MGLKAEITNLNEVGKELQQYYKANQEGKLVLDVEEVNGLALDKVDGLRTAISKEREAHGILQSEHAKLRDRYKALPNPEEALDALEKVRSGSVKSPREIEDLRQALQAKAAADRDDLEKQKLKLNTRIERELIDREMQAAFDRAAGYDEKLAQRMRKVMGPTVRSSAIVEFGQDGEPRVIIRDGTGKQIISKRYGDASPMGIQEYVDEQRNDKDFQALFPARVATGSGGGHAIGGAGQMGPKDLTKMNGLELLDQARGQARTERI